MLDRWLHHGSTRNHAPHEKALTPMVGFNPFVARNVNSPWVVLCIVYSHEAGGALAQAFLSRLGLTILVPRSNRIVVCQTLGWPILTIPYKACLL